MRAIIGIDHCQLAAPPGCEREARRFYGALLGLEEVPKPAALRARGGVWFRAGSQQLHIGVAAEFAPAQKAHPALRVRPELLAELAERLRSDGAPVQWDEQLPRQRRFHTRDPWGNRLELIALADA